MPKPHIVTCEDLNGTYTQEICSSTKRHLEESDPPCYTESRARIVLSTNIAGIHTFPEYRTTFGDKELYRGSHLWRAVHAYNDI